jgi:DNA repair photolyase
MFSMNITVQKKNARSVLSKSGIPGVDYCINPYVGCSHGCRYCYATFMKRFTGHREPWGRFVDVKVNAAAVLKREIGREAKGHVLLSSVTDPYQAAEARYQLTRACLEVLLSRPFSVGILTKSPLVLRDIDLLKRFQDMEVGLTITTDREEVRKIFEPHAPPIAARIQALKTLQENGIKTYVFIGPILPMDPEALSAKVRPYVRSVLVDNMNYVSKTGRIFRLKNLSEWLDEDFVDDIRTRLETGFGDREFSIC